MKLKAWICSGL